MRIWLDDVREMPDGFDHHVRTAAEAIQLLGGGGAGVISLDHDLGDEPNGTGYDVAKWIEQMAFAWSQGDSDGLPPLQWAVHSQNPVGVGNMIQALRNADRFWAMRPRTTERI
jgi:hypothetical protein